LRDKRRTEWQSRKSITPASNLVARAERTKKSVAMRLIQDLKAADAIVSRRVAKTVAKVLRTRHAPTNLDRTLIAQSRAISPVGRAAPVIKPAIKLLSNQH
jgi:hypothetical protein